MLFSFKKGRALIIACVVLMFIFVFLFSGCTSSHREPEQKQFHMASDPTESTPPLKEEVSKQSLEVEQHQVIIYRLTEDQQLLLPISRTVKSEGKVVEAALTELAHWEDQWSQPLLPDGVVFKGVEVQRRVAFIDLAVDKKQLHMGSAQESLVVDGLVRTATQFSTVDQAMILVNGEKQETLGGHVGIDQPLGLESYINDMDNEHPEGTKIQLYFGDQNGMYMIPVTYTVPQTTGVARSAIELLIRGPRQRNLERTIPQGVKLRDIRIEDGIAYVDFSRELRDNHWGGTSGESATISSIVYTLTSIPGIDKVQILIEGKTGQSIADHVILDQPLGKGNINFRG